MIPILYDTLTEGTVPTTYGLGALTDCINVKCQEELNGPFELSFDYPANGLHASDIQPNRFIKAKPNYTDSAQIFRIYKVGKTIKGRFTCYCQHISYDLSGKLITTGTASTCVAACALLEASAGSFTITTDKTVTAPFSVSEPSSVRSWFGGKEGSLLDVYGGEWKYDNYTASLKQARGQDRGVQIRYGKNLTDLSQVLDMSNLVTGVVPYYIDMDGKKTVGTKVSTGLTLDVPRDVAIDFSTDVDPESATPIATQLANLATAYVNNNNLTTIMNSITLDFVQSGEMTERVDLGDTVHVYFEPLGLTANAKCVATTWDVLEERYTAVTIGKVRANITETIAQNAKEVEKAASRSYLGETVTRATELITGNLGGYVVLHDSNGDGEPDEILIMDSADISTAVNVWRWNQNGLGFSSTGYSGTYATAITADGKIVADFISTGTLNADLIKAGTIEDVAHNSTIDMTNGEAILNNLKAKNNFKLIDSGDITRGIFGYNSVGGTTFTIYDENATKDAVLSAGTSDGGRFRLYEPSSGVQTIDIASSFSSLVGGQILINDTAGNKNVLLNSDTSNNGEMAIYSAGSIFVDIAASTTGVETGGVIKVYNSSGTRTIRMVGDTGDVRCVSVTQTSSRKVKDNIKPLSLEEARKVLDLEAVSFDYKNKDLGTDHRGFIAEDVAEVIPNVVTPETEEAPAALDYVQLIPYLVEVIKDQEKRIKALEEKVNGTDNT